MTRPSSVPRRAGEATGEMVEQDYFAFGLNIRSQIALPELCEARFDRPDVRIRLRPTSPDFPAPDAPWDYHFEPGLAWMSWPPVGRATMTGDHEVEIEPAPGVESRLLPFPILGPVLSYLLHLRGKLVLHGSAVAIGGRGFVFLGDKRAGKSTTAATLVAAGHPLLTDDVVAVDLEAPLEPRILPAFPQLKLSEEASAALTLKDSEALPLVMPGFEKRQHRLSSSFHPEPVPVDAVCVLKRGEELRLRPLPALDSVKALMRFSHLVNRGDAIFTPEAKARHLRQCATVAAAARIYELTVPSALDALWAVTPLLERELEAGRSDRP